MPADICRYRKISEDPRRYLKMPSGQARSDRPAALDLEPGRTGRLRTLLLPWGNYTQQCLAPPTRGEMDAAHARRRWMNIGVPRIRNLFRIKPERALLWIAIGVTGIPLHLLYNSIVHNSIEASNFVLDVVTNNHFEQTSYSNMTEAFLGFYRDFRNLTDWTKSVDSSDVELFSGVPEQYSIRNQSYEDLTPSECTKIYNAEFMTSHRNLFLITNHSHNAVHNNTVLHMTPVVAGLIAPGRSCSMAMAVVRSREPMVVTLGDAVGSSLGTADPATMGTCFADRQFVERE
ncbi:hypothetical protein HOY80DRAFT_1093547 [Tuber brumale]|nr:hypothetical protein HOY80DRAFT_1093547 [Tuber brumale]